MDQRLPGASEVATDTGLEAPLPIHSDFPVVGPRDSLNRVLAEMVRTGWDAVAVVSDGELLGLVHERDLPADPTDAEWSRLTASSLALPVPAITPDHPRIREILRARQEHPESTIFPVLNGQGRLVGLVRLREALAAALGPLRPRRIGGLATPFGVHLHCGTAMGGCGHLALFTGGIFFALLGALGWVLVFLPSWALQPYVHLNLVSVWANSGDVGLLPYAAWIYKLQSLLFLLVFLTLLRLSHVSQFHAAEHMVVSALENLEPLDIEHVARMPRVHPRCGSNIVVLLAIFFLAAFPPLDWRWIAGALLLLPFARRIGGLGQHFFSTRTPAPKHLRSALFAAEDMARNFSRHPSRPLTILSRIWFSGLVHTIAGANLAFWVFQGVESLLLGRGIL